MKIIEVGEAGKDDVLRIANIERLCWRSISASVRGSSHEKSGLPCQDKHSVESLSTGMLIVAVADGAGSAAHSEIGAALATKTVLDCLCFIQDLFESAASDSDWEQILRFAVEDARNKVFAEAGERQLNVRDLASTLIVVVATPTIVACAQVGDGAAVICDQNDQLFALTTPQSGECINETTFLISINALPTLQSTVWHGDVKHLAVFSDGIQMLCLKMPESTPHARFFSPLFRFISGITEETDAQTQLEEFLSSARIRQFTDDDLTLVLATLSETPCLI